MLSTEDLESQDSIQKRKETYSEKEIKEQADKTLTQLDLGKIGIVFSPTSSAMLKKGLDCIRDNLQNIDYGVVVVVQKDIILEEHRQEKANVKFIETPKVDVFAKKNIGRQLINTDIKYILFIDTLSYIDVDDFEITENLVKARIAPLHLEPTCGVVGEMSSQTLSEEIVEDIIGSLSKKVNFNRDVYTERCLTEDGRLRFAEANSMAVTVSIWDLFGGFNIKDQYPSIEYCLRLQLLGYKIILQQLNER